MLTRLEHARANVADLRRAVEWYTTVLGFEAMSHWPPDQPTIADPDGNQLGFVRNTRG